MNNHNEDEPQTPNNPPPVYTGTDDINTNPDALSCITASKEPPSVPSPHAPSPPTPSPSNATTAGTTKLNTSPSTDPNSRVFPSTSSNTTTTSTSSTHMIEFHHKGCPNCDISLIDEDLISSEDYEEVIGMMLSKAYDVIDVFHTGGPVVRDLELSAMWTESEQFIDLDSMDHDARKTLLCILKGNKDDYHLRVEFNTFPQQALGSGVLATATDNTPSSDSQPETKDKGGTYNSNEHYLGVQVPAPETNVKM
ncbi:hypothetical protein VM1G_00842 [Cytospora mali]|uniref:Uncharacterized protein n=1 Tax=Cytospora mali TaxID=578113 RepID=A0A194VMH0_CYTMA|nr:hypothetical protein VM1G_00842 [Valsa mali]